MRKRSIKVAIVAIGTELTLGYVSESNSEYIADRLSRLGYDVRVVLKLPDDAGMIANEVKNLLNSVDALILTGGLGSTHDDITREALAEISGAPLVLDEGLEALIAPLAPPGADRDSFLRQAYLPSGARAIGPIPGTAPGIVFSHENKTIYALPGVPAEMVALLDHMIKDMEERFGQPQAKPVRRLRLAGISEPITFKLIAPIIKSNPKITFNILAGPEEIKITMIDEGSYQGEEDLIDQVVDEMRAILKNHVFGTGEDTLPEVVGRSLAANELTLAVAESITAGHITAWLSSVPGSSNYLIGGVVAYANKAKESLLNVSHETLVSYGAVSEETAAAMAEGAREVFCADIGVSTTGIAGPTGDTPEKPIGLVYIGLSTREYIEVKEFRFKGTRRNIQRKTTAIALNLLRLHLEVENRHG